LGRKEQLDTKDGLQAFTAGVEKGFSIVNFVR
jgi:hypothetical protein